MTSSAQANAAGWYADPWGQAQSRYWDGVQWTGHVQGAAYAPAPPPPPPQQHAGNAQPGYGQAPAAPPPVAFAPQPAAPQADPQLPEPHVRSEDVVAMTDQQRRLLAKKLTFGGLFGEAWTWAFSITIALWFIGVGLTRVAGWIPIIGWVFAIWAIGGTVAIVLGTALASPLLALLLLPVVLFVKRPKFARDLAGGAASRRSGTFIVTKGAIGGKINTGGANVFVGARALESMRAALSESEPYAFDGALVFGRESGELLAGYDASGRELFLAD